MFDRMTTWKKEIEEVEKEIGEMVIHSTLTQEEAETEFDRGYGGVEGCAFTAWTENWVLFPIGYDGAEWVGQAPRNPCDKKLNHQGGW